MQRLAHDALDAVRRAEVREAGGASEAPELKRLRWALHKNPWNLTLAQDEKLADLPRINERIYRAYLLKESLAAALDGRQHNVARQRLLEWVAWATRSRLMPFKKLAATMMDHLEGNPRLRENRHDQRRSGRHEREDPHHYSTLVWIPQRGEPHRDGLPLLLRPHPAAGLQVP